MNLILTFDYELYGDGTGDVFIHMIESTNKILNLCQKNGIKATIFFEVLEYLKLKEEWANGNNMGYTKNPAEAIKKQIQQAAKDGHDIQLHIHPQWYSSKYQNVKWQLDFSNWRLSNFRASPDYGVKELISECKTEMEKIIKPVVPGYKCIALRAGGYNIIPSQEIYNAMKHAGLKLDSSVYPGGFEAGSLSKFDYRNVPVNLDYWWASEADIRNPAENEREILEVPVFALPVSRWKRVLTGSKIKLLFLRQNSAISSVTKEKIGRKSLYQKFKYMLEKEASTWDVCMFSKSLHKQYFSYIEKHLTGKHNNFVLIGHPKSLRDEKLFENFLEVAQSKKHFSFTTLKAFYDSIV
jgi:peptidoglycan/xylan/chitin deacetylase (PgdA/CDA1 family)